MGLIGRYHRQREKRAERVAKGLCVMCCKPNDNQPKKSCKKCLKRQSTYYKKLRLHKKVAKTYRELI